MNKLREWLKIVSECFFRPVCHVCRKETSDSDAYLCPVCTENVLYVQPPYCRGCGGELDGVLEFCSKCMASGERPWRNAVAVFRMEKVGADLVHSFKYSNSFELAVLLGKMACRALENSDFNFDAVVPVPLHWSRQIIRGYNQSELLADVIAREYGVKMEKLILRSKYTPKQALLKRNKRKNNLVGAFSSIKGANYKNRSILLVDDVMTTGATLTEATKVLLSAGVAEVNVLVLARR